MRCTRSCWQRLPHVAVRWPRPAVASDGCYCRSPPWHQTTAPTLLTPGGRSWTLRKQKNRGSTISAVQDTRSLTASAGTRAVTSFMLVATKTTTEPYAHCSSIQLNFSLYLKAFTGRSCYATLKSGPFIQEKTLHLHYNIRRRIHREPITIRSDSQRNYRNSFP
jgi:hypothetical protein